MTSNSKLTSKYILWYGSVLNLTCYDLANHRPPDPFEEHVGWFGQYRFSQPVKVLAEIRRFDPRLKLVLKRFAASFAKLGVTQC